MAAAVLRADGSIRISLGAILAAASCSTTIKRRSEPATTDGAPKPVPDKRSAEDWKRLSSPINFTNCFGCELRDRGQGPVPRPPQSRKGVLKEFYCHFLAVVKM